MTRWDWTWEEQNKSAPPSEKPSSPAEAAGGSPDGGGKFRRRRAMALLSLAVILLAVILTFSLRGSGHPRRMGPKRTTLASRLAIRTSHAQMTHLEEEQAINHVLSYTPVVVQGGQKGREVALTFDDGPGPYTQRLVGVLNSFGVKATFFAIGEEERYFSAGTIAELRSGDVVGDHTETHPMMASLSAHDQHEELFEQIAHIEVLGGPRPRLFRPPYGSFDATTFTQLRKFHLLMILWSTDTSDYTLPGVGAIVHSALAGAHPGAIILMHDAGGDRSQTIAALPAIIKGLRKRGLDPVTIPRLLRDDPPPAGQPIPKSLAGG
jgi:peptidoglycan/xylan/chitin deacetylase (PgdA/CDA1 family)